MDKVQCLIDRIIISQFSCNQSHNPMFPFLNAFSKEVAAGAKTEKTEDTIVTENERRTKTKTRTGKERKTGTKRSTRAGRIERRSERKRRSDEKRRRKRGRKKKKLKEVEMWPNLTIITREEGDLDLRANEGQHYIFEHYLFNSCTLSYALCRQEFWTH